MTNRITLPLILCQTLLIATLSFSSSLPISKEGVQIDAASTSEVIIQSTGVYNSDAFFKKSDVKKNGLRLADEDARKAAIYTVLFGTEDPILKTDAEKNAFKKVQDDVFKLKTVNTFISYAKPDVIKKVLLNGGKGIKVTNQYRVNTEKLKEYLVKKEVIASLESVTESLGNPFVMVLPMSKQGQTGMELLNADANLRHAAGVIQGFLTARQYDVVVPDQQGFLQDLNMAQIVADGKTEDPAYQLALSVGSDIYFDYSIEVSGAAYDTQKVSATIRAYETTTARLLGSETGYSQERKGEIQLGIEEALLQATNAVLSRVTTYWKSDLDKGVQYKIIVTIAPDVFTPKNVDAIQDAFDEILGDMAENYKTNVLTKRSGDYLIWVDPEEYDQSRDLWRKIRTQFSQKIAFANIEIINQNRKLLLLNITL